MTDIKSRCATNHKIIRTDPETLDWNPLSAEVLTLLDSRPYISPSRDRRLNGIAITSMDKDDQSYIEGNKEPVISAADTDGVSLFHVHMPGILSEEEIFHGLEELGKWGLLCADRTYRLEVCELMSLMRGPPRLPPPHHVKALDGMAVDRPRGTSSTLETVC